jgi:hypothetical protein
MLEMGIGAAKLGSAAPKRTGHVSGRDLTSMFVSSEQHHCDEMYDPDGAMVVHLFVTFLFLSH